MHEYFFKYTATYHHYGRKWNKTLRCCKQCKISRNPGQNNIFHNALALNADSITNGVFLYPSFLAITVLSESFFFSLKVVDPPSLISANFTLFVASYSLIPFSPVMVMGCCELEKILIHDDSPNRGIASVNKITCFFILTSFGFIVCKNRIFLRFVKTVMLLLGEVHCCG